MKPKARALEFLPLSEFELELCVELLRHRNNQSLEKRVAGAAIKHSRVFDVAEFILESRRLRNKRRVLALAFERAAKLDDLSVQDARQRWRDRIVCHAMVFPEELAKYRASSKNGGMFDFDAYSVAAYSFDLKFRVAVEPARASSRYGKFDVRVVPQIRSLGDFVDWLFWRAILNFQFSRFAHCCVCDRWVLKRIAGQRSSVTINRIQKQVTSSSVTVTINRIKKQVTKSGINFKNAPLWFGLLPLWPAVCDSQKCKTLFQHVVRGKSPNRVRDFRGLLGSQNTRA